LVTFKKNGALNISEWNGKFVKTDFDPSQTSIKTLNNIEIDGN
jgi:hypothetical protein